MNTLLNDHFDKILALIVFIIVALMWIDRATPFTERITEDVIIAVVAFLTGKVTNSSKGSL